ncbi:pimeloyl-ACP methyl ester carboxylesterase [Saccharopolyspora erythraea NRRL 2338]|uniref:Oxidoreductase n=1 Tax=Saccharopolyspora erythraea (strain ATCC 11635 / DSM 40517 / JCM 4748 / NBRC 13426 / NCIMB 8594 / NRRL 2338) TaxID=405948 RepID=A4FIX9_SACEN|nr:alpha/beta hydrolase [Saccharopolyspora erythraea]EQD86162.1 alpha/beta hydrolase [Saccharopolyspora erythraea D]PFG97677.1 pimeloyl-ACP methyl ester carboxylesterase [Saccharopolyspora erythraea NRRL 2338]QRK87830.1 alpha/beta hydrolase [Saccharopolyspora erythraea]CAM04004.1 oxidoreductase [Saccharopolyspora erythraea NRRL 2338]
MDDWQLTAAYSSGLGEVRWEKLGAPDAEPLVLLHGTPFSSYIWRDIAATLAHRYRVHVWDMPGYGVSEMSEAQDLSLGAITSVFAELLDHWGLAEPLVVAHDSGGAIALGAHLLHNARYRRLALVDAVALGPWGSAFFEVVGGHADVFAGLPLRVHQALLREYVNSASSRGLHPATLDALAAPWMDEPGQAAFYRQLGQRTNDPSFIDEIQGRYERIGIPVKICWGQDDTWMPEARGRELAARIPEATFHPVPRAGHLVQEDNPADLTATLVDFLRGWGPFTGGG